jgi:hypothetical protein
MLASPELLHALSYTRTGVRLSSRHGGHEERPPIGLVSLPQVLVPHIYGSNEGDSFPMLPKKEANIVETPAAGFAGIVAALALAPLAFADRQRRWMAGFLVVIALLGLGWCLDIPGLVWVMRIPGINLLPYNRFVFASSFAIIFLAAIGLEKRGARDLGWRWWYYVPVVLLAALTGWFALRTFWLPQEIAHDLPQAIAQHTAPERFHDLSDAHRVQFGFRRMYMMACAASLLGLLVWLSLRLRASLARRVSLVAGCAVVAELLQFGYGRAGQCDPTLYYPKLGPVEEIAVDSNQRTLGFNCLPANLLQVKGLLDVRGYDGVDPARYIELMDLGRQPGTTRLDYAAVQYFVPQVSDSGFVGSVRLSPILDLLGVRHLVCLTTDRTQYLVLINNLALPRVFIPSSVELENVGDRRLANLGSPWFDPRTVAYVEGSPDAAVAGQGEARIIESNSQRLTISTEMTRRGLAVVTDRWDGGWRAYINGTRAPLVHVDHALTGIIAPEGSSTIVLKYEPVSWRIGLMLAGVAILILLASISLPRRRQRAAPNSSPGSARKLPA